MDQPAKKNYWVKSGILNLLQNFSGAFFGVVGVMIMTRLLSETQLGIWGLFLTVGSIMEMVRNGLIQSAVIKFVSSKPEEESDVLTAALVISGLLTVVCTIFIICFAGMLGHLLKAPGLDYLLYLYIIIFIVSGVMAQLCYIEQAHFSYQGVVASNIIRQFVFFAFLVVCFILKRVPDLKVMVYIQIAGALLGAGTAWFYVKRYVIFSFKLSMNWVKQIFHYGKYAFGTALSSLLSGTIDQWMISGIINPASMASFRVAIQVTNLVDIPTNTIATIVFPQSAKRMETDGKQAIRYLYERSVGAILAVLIPAIFFMYLFDDVVMSLLASKKYIKAVPILNVTLLYALLIPYGRQFGAILDSIGKTKATFALVVFTASLNLGLNFFFIRQWGPLGAAYATLCSNIVGFAIAQRILYKELGVNAFHPLIYAVHFYTEFYKNHLKKYFVKEKSI